MKDLSKIGQVLSEENKTGEVCVIRLVSACAVPNAQHAPSAIAELAPLASKAKSETARIAAICELLDRGVDMAGLDKPSRSLHPRRIPLRGRCAVKKYRSL
jgi:hypothetical protein